jgi:hypothetical protein
MQLNPREIYTIARGLEDHTISTVFYVRAVIRNARTQEIIDTVNLENQGDNHRYSEDWQVPPDISGHGFWILIAISVYTDALYTTKSSQYADKYEEHLVQQRPDTNLGMGGGGVDVDYKKIQKMIDSAIAKVPKPEKVTIPKVDLEPVLSSLEKISDLVSSIRIPEPIPVDFSAVLKRIDLAIEAANDKNMTEAQIAPLHDLHQRFSDLLESNSSDSVRQQLEEVVRKTVDALQKIQSYFTSDIEEVKGDLKDVKQLLGNSVGYIMKEKEKAEPKKSVNPLAVL